jgi:succinate dehydrogenase hydrophobic anchor subunit
MDSSTPRALGIALTILTLITATNHLFIGMNTLSEPDMTVLGVLFILNGIGFVVLPAAILSGYVPVLSNRKKLAHYVMLAFTGVTLLAYIFLSGILKGKSPMPVAIITKVDEVILMVVTYLHMRRSVI